MGLDYFSGDDFTPKGARKEIERYEVGLLENQEIARKREKEALELGDIEKAERERLNVESFDEYIRGGRERIRDLRLRLEGIKSAGEDEENIHE